MNSRFKFKITVLFTFLNQNSTYVVLLHIKSKQVKVATKKTTQEYFFVEKITVLKSTFGKSILLLYTTGVLLDFDSLPF